MDFWFDSDIADGELFNLEGAAAPAEVPATHYLFGAMEAEIKRIQKKFRDDLDEEDEELLVIYG